MQAAEAEGVQSLEGSWRGSGWNRRAGRKTKRMANLIAKQKEGKDGVLLSQPAILVDDGDEINIKNNERKL